MLPGSPTALANSGSMWIGLKSPEAPAYRCGRYLSGVTRSSSIWSPSFTSASSDDVGPDAANRLVAVLVARDRLEHEEVVAALLVDVGELDVGRDLVTGADGLAPDELLAAVQHLHQVDAHVRVEHGRPHRGRRVDDREHRRRHDVAEARGLGGFAVVVDRLGLAHRVRGLADLLAPDLVGTRRPGLALLALVCCHRLSFPYACLPRPRQPLGRPRAPPRSRTTWRSCPPRRARSRRPRPSSPRPCVRARGRSRDARPPR